MRRRQPPAALAIHIYCDEPAAKTLIRALQRYAHTWPFKTSELARMTGADPKTVRRHLAELELEMPREHVRVVHMDGPFLRLPNTGEKRWNASMRLLGAFVLERATRLRGRLATDPELSAYIPSLADAAVDLRPGADREKVRDWSEETWRRIRTRSSAWREKTIGCVARAGMRIPLTLRDLDITQLQGEAAHMTRPEKTLAEPESGEYTATKMGNTPPPESGEYTATTIQPPLRRPCTDSNDLGGTPLEAAPDEREIALPEPKPQPPVYPSSAAKRHEPGLAEMLRQIFPSKSRSQLLRLAFHVGRWLSPQELAAHPEWQHSQSLFRKHWSTPGGIDASCPGIRRSFDCVREEALCDA